MVSVDLTCPVKSETIRACRKLPKILVTGRKITAARSTLVLTYDFFRFVSLPLNLYEDPPPLPVIPSIDRLRFEPYRSLGSVSSTGPWQSPFRQHRKEITL